MTAYSVAYGEERIGFALRLQPRLKGHVAIHVTSDGLVMVDAPPGCALQDVKAAVRQRAAWVWHQLEAQRARQGHVPPRVYLSGETHFYLGRRHALKVAVATKQADAGTRLWRGRLEVRTVQPGIHAVRRSLETWYRERATAVFGQVLVRVAAQMELPAPLPPWRLQSMRTQWGSCSPKGALLLNPDLVKAPKACIEYVVAHELCHLKEHNHSERFYRLLGSVMPDWRRRKQELDGLAELVLGR